MEIVMAGMIKIKREELHRVLANLVRFNDAEEILIDAKTVPDEFKSRSLNAEKVKEPCTTTITIVMKGEGICYQ